jgi:serine/threonine protein kinase
MECNILVEFLNFTHPSSLYSPHKLISFSSLSSTEMNKIIHRDLALRNVLCGGTEPKMLVKVCDFGLSRTVDGDYYKSTSGSIPYKWSAPEVLTRGRYSHKVRKKKGKKKKKKQIHSTPSCRVIPGALEWSCGSCTVLEAIPTQGWTILKQLNGW